MRNRPPLSVPVLVMACLCIGARGVEPTPPTGSQGKFTSARTTIWEGRTQVLAFELERAALEDRSLEVRSDDDALVSIERDCEVLAGETRGWLRVRGEAEGETTLRIGEEAIALRVRAPGSEATANGLSVEITAPAPGAVVWGSVAVGVELEAGLDDDLRRDPRVRLRLSTGELLEPSGVLPLAQGPTRRLWFEVDLAGVPPGPLSLRALISRRDGQVVTSAARSLTVVRPSADELHSGECEDLIDAPRPEAFGERLPRLGGAPDASGGAFTAHFEGDPTLLLPLEVERPGRYQLLVRARGDFGAGAFPSLGLCLDDPYQHQTAVRLVAREWQRLPVGVPLTLEAGAHHLALRFINHDPRRAQGRRNLFLDRYELYRLPDVDDGAIDAGAGMAMMAMSMDDSEGSEGGLHIAATRVVHGLPVCGRLELRAWCLWPDPERTPAPRVALLLNGAEVQVQQASQPVFALDRAALRVGPNRVQMVATLEDGRRASTPEQVVFVDQAVGDQAPREYFRFDVVDERWDSSIAALLEPEDAYRRQHRAAKLGPDRRAQLALPPELSGAFEVLVETRGEGHPDTSRLELLLRTGDGEREIAQTDIGGWWTFHEGGEVELPAGEKTLVVSATSGPECWLRSVVLREARPGPDRVPPRAEIRWPAAGHLAWGAEAVVVRAADDLRLVSADVLVDGRPQATYGRVRRDGAGYVVLPLVLRDLAPGAHRLRVRVTDEAGNLGESAELAFEVAAEAPRTPGAYARALHLLDRFAYGPEPDELAALLELGEEAWLARRLGPRGAGELAALAAAEAGVLEGGYFDAQRGLVTHALLTPNPVRQRFVLWLENHFSTWIQKASPGPEWREHREWQRLGPAPFAECLATSATSTAMLQYLDQAQSLSGALNENYARELMELHTLGVDGGYDQADVTALAGLLCGMTLSDEATESGAAMFLKREYRYDPDLADGRAREVLGMRFGATRAELRHDEVRRALELLVAHPGTALHVARSLVEHYVAVPAPEPLVNDLARVFTALGGDLGAVLRALARHELFWVAMDEPRVVTPLDFGLRLGRTTESPELEWAVRDFLSRSGMGVMDRVSPDGWPEANGDWVDSNTLLQRWSLPGRVPWALGRTIPDALRNPPSGDRGAWRQRVVDVVAARLLGRPLGEESNGAVLDYVAGLEGNAWVVTEEAAVMIARMPEAGLR